MDAVRAFVARVSEEFQQRFIVVARAVDNVLVAGHGLRHGLAEDHLPFSATLTEGLARYGEGPVLHLWLMCRALDELRSVWTGQPRETVEQGEQ